ncbi:L,D-transpeptidase family protein [Rhodobacteraceae bacterium 2CG4]|uniref:L,D-transpeptidase family protein n=1 Tax=Halovulum marinum TaxID=2662447 RepID=A0A6L5YV35_9RHOB|nr:L,D-transpeptidase [Halovulum marinum]MSU88138.1 L,D-transpeptidase family protein [Halovulum marinum]
MLTRRHFLAASAAASLSATAAATASAQTQSVSAAATAVRPPIPPLPDFYGAITDEPFPIPAVPEGMVPPHLWRQPVANPWPEHAPGTIVVDPDAALLHFVESPQIATRYGVSVGAAGFDWEGTARLQFIRDWPRWKVPDSMIERQPDLAPYSWRTGGMDPGPDNPMGARALYLFQNGVDTLYRIHGSANAWELGKAVSSGCIRMLNQDVIDLAERSVHGATVVVLPSQPWRGIGQLY